MIDIGSKKVISRKAKSTGTIYLQSKTLKKIKSGDIKKGDVFEAAKVAGMIAIKQTSYSLAYCHQIPIESTQFRFSIESDKVIVECNVQTTAKTGVEMESIVGVQMALATIWDMVKYLEKDENGQYPKTRITDIKVIEKVKG